MFRYARLVPSYMTNIDCFLTLRSWHKMNHIVGMIYLWRQSIVPDCKWEDIFRC